jgi:hypothetical protein
MLDLSAFPEKRQRDCHATPYRGCGTGGSRVSAPTAPDAVRWQWQSVSRMCTVLVPQNICFSEH